MLSFERTWKHICIYCLAATLGNASLALTTEAQDGGFPVIVSYSAGDIGVEGPTWTGIQDKDGVLYFGGNSLITFDGDRWRSFSIPGGYAIRGLEFGENGRLWAAAAGTVGWFTQQANQDWVFHSLREHVQPEHESLLRGVWRVFSDKDEAVFVAEDGVFRWNGSRFQHWPMGGTRRLFSMRVGPSVFVHHQPTGIYVIDPSGPRLLIPHHQLPNRGIFWMESVPGGWLLASSAGLFIYRDGTLHPFAPDVAEFLSREFLTCATRLPDGRIALGTHKGGIAVLHTNGALSGKLNEQNGLPSLAVNSLLVEGNGVWATSPTNIFRVALTSTSTVFDARARVPKKPVESIVRHAGSIFFATSEGVYELPAGAVEVQPIPGLRAHYRALRSTEDALFASGFHGTVALAGDKITNKRLIPQDAYAISASSRSPDQMFISEGGNIAVMGDETGRVVVENLPDMVTSIAGDTKGRLWLGTPARGVLVAKIEQALPVSATIPTNFGLPDLVSSPAVVLATEKGAIVILSKKGGWLMPIGTESFQPVFDYPDLPVAAASNFDQNNTAWVIHAGDSGRAPFLAQLKVTGDRALWQPHSIDGLGSIGIPRSVFSETVDGSTVLWIGGTQGVLRHVVTSFPIVPRPRLPLLRAFLSDNLRGTRTPVTGALPYSTPIIEFEFSVSDYGRREALRLETRIDGVDDNWIPAASSSKRELAAVRDGAYKFRVRAIAEGGITSEEAVLDFKVLPPWWRTAPAVVTGLFVLVPFGYAIYWLRLRRLKLHNEHLEQKVHERTEELERASAAKTEFVANMSHDIRNPLNGIVGLTLALEDTRLDSNQRDLVATLRECTTYLSSLVDDVLDFASIEAGKVELRTAPFTPGELLNSVVTTLKADTAECGASIYVEVDPALPGHISGDAGRVQQILVNYVSNALKYAGGDILVSASIPSDAPDEIEFCVADRGQGISEDEKSTLFTKFTRLSGARQAEIKGSGLGLASCRVLADIMGGSVGVDSKLGEGSRFYLRLPLAEATPVEAAATDELPNTTVLLVEDTDYNALAATAVLRRLGLSCERARTGAEALQLFAAKRFNLVLLDRNLPDMDGVEVARQMRQLETDGLQAIVLAVTAYCTAKDKQVCLDAGMDAFVGKPLTPEKLRKVLLTTGRRLLASSTLDVSQETPAPAVDHRAIAPALDVSLLTYLSDGTSRGFDLQVERFLTTLAAVVADIDSAFAARNFDDLGAAAHKLLGQARMIGGSALTEIAEQLEESARQRDSAQCEEQLRRMTAEIANLTEALRRRRSSAATN